MLNKVDWQGMFIPDMSLLEIFIRGTVVYLFLFVMLRLTKRQSGSISISDLLVVVLIADAIQNAMSASYNSLTDGIMLVLTILFWSYVINWAGFHFPKFQKLVDPKPTLLYKDGDYVEENMKITLITKDELQSKVRQDGVEDITEIKEAYLEGDGNISIIEKKKES